jgi:hypothetical protein
MVLTIAGIMAGWQVETMPQRRIMVEPILLPDGRVLLVNGAKTGVAGYGDVCDAHLTFVMRRIFTARLPRSGTRSGRATPTTLPSRR